MDVQKHEMKNGLVVATEAMPHLRSVSIGVWVRGGSRYEEDGIRGISHFIEHLLFKGTETRSTEDIAKVIDSVGGQLNAFTDKEYVGFYAKVLDRHVPLAFELLSDIILHPTFPAAEIRRERNVIFEEISMVEDSPQDLIQDILMESFWREHPLGLPVSGTKESVAGITRAQVMRYFRRNYTAANTIVSAAGNLRHRDVLALAARYFSALETGSPVEPGPPPVNHAVQVVRTKPNLEQTHVCVAAPCPQMESEDRYGAHLLCAILGGGMSSRLFQNIREKRGLVYSIYSTLNLYRDAGTMMIYAGSAPRAAARVLELTAKELRVLREKPVTPDELARAKENMKGSIMLSLESSSSRMTHLAQQQLYFGRFFPMQQILDRFDAVRAKDIRRLANEIFDSSSMTLATLGSDGRELESISLKV